jgi:hypothetical protein
MHVLVPHSPHSVHLHHHHLQTQTVKIHSIQENGPAPSLSFLFVELDLGEYVVWSFQHPAIKPPKVHVLMEIHFSPHAWPYPMSARLGPMLVVSHIHPPIPNALPVPGPCWPPKPGLGFIRPPPSRAHCTPSPCWARPRPQHRDYRAMPTPPRPGHGRSLPWATLPSPSPHQSDHSQASSSPSLRRPSPHLCLRDCHCAWCCVPTRFRRYEKFGRPSEVVL